MLKRCVTPFSRNPFLSTVSFRAMTSTKGTFVLDKPNKTFKLTLPDNRGDVVITYREKEDNVYILNHTGTPDGETGKGLAGEVARLTFDYLQENNIKAIPTCSYLIHFLSKNPQYQAVVQKL